MNGVLLFKFQLGKLWGKLHKTLLSVTVPLGPEPPPPPPPLLHFSSYSKNVYLLEVWSLQIRNYPTPDPETLKSLIDSSF